MKNVLAYIILSTSLISCTTDNSNKAWHSQLNENEKLAPQIVALLGVKELKENCTNIYCCIYLQEVCRSIYFEEKIERAQINKMVASIGLQHDWVPAKIKKIADQVWQAYLDFKTKNYEKK